MFIMVITMKNNSYKQKLYEKEERRQKSIKRMKPEQVETYAKNLLSRIQRKTEIKKKIMEILSSEPNLAIADIQKRLGLNRNTFNYWIKMFEKEGWFKRKSLELEGEEARGRPKTLVLNKKKIKEAEYFSSKHWKSFEEFNLRSILTDKIMEEINKQPNSHKQLQKMMELFKQDSGYGAKLIFLLYEEYLKVDYKLSLTAKGKVYLKKNKKRIINSSKLS